MNLKSLTLPIAAVAAFIAMGVAPSHADSAEMTAPGTDIVSVARQSAQFSTLSRAIDAAGLAETLSAAGPYTVFAPTDEAFAKLPPEKLAELMKPENKAQLAKLLTLHVVSGKAYEPDELKKRRDVETVSGESVKVALVNGRLRVGDARVKGDVEASNGVILPIDRVLIPE